MNGKVNITVSMGSASASLQKIPEEARDAVRRAVNDTAKNARTRLATKAQETFVVKNAGFNKEMHIRNASKNTLAAHITATGKPIPLYKFKVKGSVRKKAAMAQQKAGSVLKEIISQRSAGKAFTIKTRAFLGKDKTGETKYSKSKSYTGIFQRKGKEKYPIKQFYGSSIPVIIKSVDVYGTVESHIGAELIKNVNRHIRLKLERLKKGAGK